VTGELGGDDVPGGDAPAEGAFERPPLRGLDTAGVAFDLLGDGSGAPAWLIDFLPSLFAESPLSHRTAPGPARFPDWVGRTGCFAERSAGSGPGGSVQRDGERTGRLGDQRSPRRGARQTGQAARTVTRARSSTPSGRSPPNRSTPITIVAVPGQRHRAFAMIPVRSGDTPTQQSSHAASQGRSPEARRPGRRDRGPRRVLDARAHEVRWSGRRSVAGARAGERCPPECVHASRPPGPPVPPPQPVFPIPTTPSTSPAARAAGSAHRAASSARSALRAAFPPPALRPP